MWPAQLILIAMGFLGPPREGLVSDLKLETTDRGSLQVDRNKMTNVEGVFAAGDIERGQSLVVWAIADGRKAAQGVNQFLRDPNNLIEPALSNC
jgi:glutamate synthase (NADPH/NADH) small chain